MPSFTFKKIDIPGGPGTDGFVYISVDGVDAAGLAVGNFGDTDGDWHGFTVTPTTPFTQYDPPSSSNNTDIVGVTQSGEIYGNFTDWSNQQHGFIVNNGVTTTVDVPFLFTSGTSISGISSTGVIFGTYYDDIITTELGTPTLDSFIDINGTFSEFMAPRATYAIIDGISTSGEIFGTSSAGAFIDNGGNFTFLNYPGATNTAIAAITSGGEIIGTYEDGASQQQVFIDNSGVYSTLNVPGATAIYLGGVSDSGEIVGTYIDNASNLHGFVDQNGTITTVDVPGATETQILGINAAGEIYGDYNDSSGQHGFVGIPGPIDEVYQAVLQRMPTTAEENAAASQDTSAVIAGVVGSSEAQFNVYPVIQIIDLALGQNPTAAQLAGWVPFVESQGLLQGQSKTNPLLDQMANAFVASDNFGKVYNNGVDVDPNSRVTAQEMQVIIQAATGVAATHAQINTWVGTGLTIDQVFVDFALGDQYTAASQAGTQQFLTELANNAITQTSVIGVADSVHVMDH